MCVVCGCSQHPSASSIDSATAGDASPIVNAVTGDLHFGTGKAQVSVPGMSQARAIKLEADVLGENSRLARRNRAHFAAHGVTAYDLVSSPGSGKTTLLCKTIEVLASRSPSLPVAVIEGDQQTSLDADRIRQTGVSAVQVNTGKGCHLDARMVDAAFAELDWHAAKHDHLHRHDHERESTHASHSATQNVHAEQHLSTDPSYSHEARHIDDTPGALLLIENVGNLVCPALWDLGEAAKIVILSVTEGADKPLKYPDMFAASSLMLLNKIDLLPYVDFDVEKCIEAAQRINPDIQVLGLSATSGEGIDGWIDWLLQRRGQAHA